MPTIAAATAKLAISAVEMGRGAPDERGTLLAPTCALCLHPHQPRILLLLPFAEATLRGIRPLVISGGGRSDREADQFASHAHENDGCQYHHTQPS